MSQAQVASVWRYGSGGTWTTTTNWLPFFTPGSNVGDIAVVQSNITADQTITLDGARTLGVMVLGDQSGTSNFTIAPGSGGSLTFDNIGDIALLNRITGGNDTINANITLNDDLRVRNFINDNARALVIGGTVSGPGSLTFLGNGRLQILGQINTDLLVDNRNSNNNADQVTLGRTTGNAVTGDITIGNVTTGGVGYAILELAAGRANTDLISDSSRVIIDGLANTTTVASVNPDSGGRWAKFDLNGVNETIGSLMDTRGGAVLRSTGSNPSTLTIAGSGDSFFEGVIQDGGSGAFSINNSGSGNLTLEGAWIRHTGTTGVSGTGTLELKNLTTDFVSSGIQVGPAGTLVLTKTTNNNLTLSQRVTGGGDVVFNASGTTNSGLTLSASNNVIGDLSVNLGRAIFSGSNNTFASIHVGGHDLIGLGELQLNGSASVAGDVTLVGTGNTNSETEFRGAVSVGGAISINNGTLKLLNNGAITTNAPITVAARPTSSNLSGLVLDNSSVSNGNRIGTGAITYYGGEFNFNGGGGTNESLGSLTLNQGAFYFNHSGTGTVTFSNLTRSAGSTLNIGRADLGTTSSNRLLFTSGTPGMTNSVVSGGWAVVGTDWATIGANGITALTTYETSTSQSNWATTENIKIEAGSVSGVTSRTIATLNFSGATNRTLNMSTTTQTLTIGNGGILSSGANHTLGTNGNLTTSGGAPLHFHVQDHQLNLTSTLTGSMAVVKSGNGLLILNDGANSHTGGLIINQGTVRVNGVERMLGAIPATSNPNSVQINGGILQFHGGTGSVINVDPKRGIHIGEAGGRIAVGANITNLIDVTIPQVSADGILELAVEGPAGAGSSLVLGTTGVAANFASGIRMLGGFEGDTTFLGNNTIGGAVTINSGDVTFSGTNDFQGDLRISSATLTLLGANTVGGDIRVNSGALVLGAANALGSGPVAISLVGSDSVSGGDLDLGGYDLEIGSFYEDSVNSTIDNDGTSLFSTLTFSNDRRVVVNALIQEGLSYLNLKKTGIGELLLQNNSSTFSGNVEIFEGALTVRSIANEGLPSGLGVLYSAADPATLVLDGGALVMDLLNASVTDRSFTLGTGPNAGALVSNAGLSPSSVFIGGANSAPVAFTGSGDRTLTLGGLNLGDNTFNLVLGDGPGGVTSLIKEDRGVWHINSSNTYTGLTTVLGAINSSYGSGTSRLYVGANEALGAAGGAGTILASGGLFLDNVNYTTPENLYFEGGILESEAGYSTWAGDWYVNVNSYLRLQEGATIHQNGDLIGTRSLEILGGGTLELAGTHQTGGASNADYYAAEVRLREGGLVLDYTVNNNSKLANGNILRLGGGRREAILTLRGGNHVELINRAQLDAGRIEVYRDGGTSTINFGNLSGGAVANGASLYVDEEDLVRTTRDNVNGILGSWVTVRDNIAGTGDISWGLKNAGTGANGFIVALSPSSYIINAFATGGNTDVTASFTVPSGSTTNTLRFNEPVDAAVVLSGGSNNIQSGGILVTPSVDWAQPCIEGPGTLYTQAATLQVNQYNLNAPFTIAAEITNDGATARSLDVVGGGTVVLTEANSYTGVTTISGSTLLATQLADGGVPSSIGASTNSNGNLQLIGGTLEYLGESTSTNRGFTLANSGTISVGHDRTILTQTGSISPNDTESTDTVIKAGTGTWAFSGVASGVRSWDIAEGTLQLLSNSANNRFGNPTYATLRVSGGTLEYVGDTAASRSQQFGAEFVVGQGGSTIGVTSVADGGTARNATLILQGGEVNTSVIREPGGVVHFFENP
ncbi:MAG: autotransporter-associated beta strand repeat-containing protein, partial [Verrucomicrobiales bacterium]|nr:autotransporter-associated beta strand repeat-containing protein [Verrucomicrobiales bacterium]